MNERLRDSGANVIDVSLVLKRVDDGVTLKIVSPEGLLVHCHIDGFTEVTVDEADWNKK